MTISTFEYINETEFENDPFATVEEDTVSHGYPNNTIFGYYVIVVTILKLISILAVIIGDIFLIIVIIRFKRLRAIKTNIYILNMFILNFVYYLCAPLFYIIDNIFSSYESFSTILLQTQMTLLILYMTFSIGLALDWFLSAKKPHLMKKLDNFYLYIYIGIYVSFFVEWIISFLYSEQHHIARAGLFIIFYLIYLTISIILNVLKKKMNFLSQSKKTEYALLVSNIVIFSFLPIFLFHLILQVFVDTVQVVFLFIEIIPEMVEIGHPIWIIYVLGRYNKYFKIAYYKSFNRSVQGYETDDLDAISEEDSRSIITTNNLQFSLNGIQEDV